MKHLFKTIDKFVIVGKPPLSGILQWKSWKKALIFPKISEREFDVFPALKIQPFLEKAAFWYLITSI